MELYVTSDRCITITLLSCKLEIMEKQRKGRKVFFGFEKSKAEPIIRAWSSGKSIPVTDIRDVFNAETTFNSAVHDEI